MALQPACQNIVHKVRLSVSPTTSTLAQQQGEPADAPLNLAAHKGACRKQVFRRGVALDACRAGPGALGNLSQGWRQARHVIRCRRRRAPTVPQQSTQVNPRRRASASNIHTHTHTHIPSAQESQHRRLPPRSHLGHSSVWNSCFCFMSFLYQLLHIYTTSSKQQSGAKGRSTNAPTAWRGRMHHLSSPLPCTPVGP